LFIGATFVAMENHRTDSIPNDSYPVKSDRLLDNDFRRVHIHGTRGRGAVRSIRSGRALDCAVIIVRAILFLALLGAKHFLRY